MLDSPPKIECDRFMAIVTAGSGSTILSLTEQAHSELLESEAARLQYLVERQGIRKGELVISRGAKQWYDNRSPVGNLTTSGYSHGEFDTPKFHLDTFGVRLVHDAAMYDFLARDASSFLTAETPGSDIRRCAYHVYAPWLKRVLTRAKQAGVRLHHAGDDAKRKVLRGGALFKFVAGTLAEEVSVDTAECCITETCKDRTISFGQFFLRAVHIESCGPVRGLTLQIWRDLPLLRSAYLEHGVAVVDQALHPSVWRLLYRCMVRSTVWFSTKNSDGTLNARNYALPQGLFEQVGLELEAALSAAGLPIKHLIDWHSYKSARAGGRGVGIHSDMGSDAPSVNVDIFMTPEAANLDPTTGGLRVYRAGVPVGVNAFEAGMLDWDATPRVGVPRDTYRELLERAAFQHTHIPYQANRLIVFDSSLFHETVAPVNFIDSHAGHRMFLAYQFTSEEERNQLCTGKGSGQQHSDVPNFCRYLSYDM